jgi:predicted pyridoxine 5'-phosphate oxidase superfamily flavin-nucleotide-binding protein
MIPASVQDLVTRWRLGFIATVLPDGRPNVSPKGTFLILNDRTLAFAEIRSPGTLAGIAHQPEVEVSFVDAFVRKGARLRGPATVHPRGTGKFDALLPPFAAEWPTLLHRMNALVTIAVTEVRPLSTPPYDDGATEEDMIALYRAKFGAMYP